MTWTNAHTLASLRVDRLTARLERELAGLLADPTNRARVVHMLTLVTRVGPDLSDAHLLILARFGLATFLFDDAADRAGLDVADVVWRAEQLCTCLGDAPAPELHFDPTARLLRDAARSLAEADADPRLLALWQDLARASFRAMATQCVQADQRQKGLAVPSDELREAGRQSVAIEALCAASWVLLGVPWEAVAVLAPQAHALAQAVRLANDLRSLPRDREEGSINTLADLCPAEIAVRQAEIELDIDDALGQVEILPLAAARAAALDLALCRAIVRFYGAQDFHDHLVDDVCAVPARQAA